MVDLAGMERFEEAEDEASAVFETHPAAGASLLVRILEARGKREEAIARLEEARGKRSLPPPQLWLLARLYLDSGDLAQLSIDARRILDEAGFADAKIVASNDLDEALSSPAAILFNS